MKTTFPLVLFFGLLLNCGQNKSKSNDGAPASSLEIKDNPDDVLVSEKGEMKEQIYDVVWSGNRKIGADGKLPSVGNTVNLESPTYNNSIGSLALMGTWSDLDFDPALRATCYVRVIEIPTPRWTTYDAVRAGLPLLKDAKSTFQKRAWSSPIWYRPKS